MSEKEQVNFTNLVVRAHEGALTEDERLLLKSLMKLPQYRKLYFAATKVSCALRQVDASQFCGNDAPQAFPAVDMKLLEELAESERQAPKVERVEETDAAPHKVIKPVIEKRRMSRFQKLTLSACAAIILLLLSLNFLTEKTYCVDVATVADQMNARWLGSAAGLRSGERLWTNKDLLWLDKGFANIKFDDGVDVVIEGPAKFSIERSGLYLEYGRLFSKVPGTGLGFTIKTPTSQFVDLGTEFGVQADINGSSELHVIKGKVQLFAGAQGNAKSSRVVAENIAVLYNSGRDMISEIPYEREAFARSIDSKSRSVWRGAQQAQFDALVKSMGASAYFRLTSNQPESFQDILKNQGVEISLRDDISVSQAQQKENGSLLDALRVEGEQASVQLGKLGSIRQHERRYYTIALQLRFDSIGEQVIFRDVTRETDDFSRIMTMDDEGHIVHGAYGARLKGVRVAVSSEALEPGRWYFVAVTRAMEPANEKVLYINGRRVAQDVIESAKDTINPYGKLQIGGSAATFDGMTGEVGSVAFFPKALTEQEIMQLYESIPPEKKEL